MSRRCDELIDVRVAREVVRFTPGGRIPGALDDEVPDRFVWRGRFYLVREVMSSWRERQAWWKHPILHENASVATDQGSPDEARAVLTVLAAGADRQVWRVRASAGAQASIGVYDLALDPLAAQPQNRTVGGRTEDEVGAVEGRIPARSQPGAWRLVRVSD